MHTPPLASPPLPSSPPSFLFSASIYVHKALLPRDPSTGKYIYDDNYTPMHAVLAKQLTQEQKREAHNRKASVRVRRAVRAAFGKSVGHVRDAMKALEGRWEEWAKRGGEWMGECAEKVARGAEEVREGVREGVRDAVGWVAGWVELGVDLGTKAMDAAFEHLGFEEEYGDYDDFDA